MMIAFFRDLWKYRSQVRKQSLWMNKFIRKRNYVLNPNPMMRTQLKVWLSEMEEIFGARYCPCFEPSGDKVLDRKMSCPCTFIEDEIAEYGTCHCALFGPTDLDRAGWKASSARLMSEYRVGLNLQDGILDTRGKPRDSRRDLPVPDAMHQLKSTLNDYGAPKLRLLLEREQEAINLERIATHRGYGYSRSREDDVLVVDLVLKPDVGDQKT